MDTTLPTDPRSWQQSDVDGFTDKATPAEVASVLLALLESADEVALNVLVFFLGAVDSTIRWSKPLPSQMALRALLSIGQRGADRILVAFRSSSDDLRYHPSLLKVVWRVGRGEGFAFDTVEPFADLAPFALPVGTEHVARRVIRELFAEARVNAGVFQLVANFLSNAADELWVSERRAVSAVNHAFDTMLADQSVALMSLFAEGAIRLSRSVLDEFSAMIAADLPEERYQEFLSLHPVILDPLAAEVISKQRLGLEYATDFAVRSHDDRWLLVEIERPQDELFTKGNDFRERFTHAFGQVLDFHHWVDDNVAYAQRHMPHIASPHGLLVIGLRSRLTDLQQSKLRRFCGNSRRIDVQTYDDLWKRATSLYENLFHCQS